MDMPLEVAVGMYHLARTLGDARAGPTRPESYQDFEAETYATLGIAQ